MNRTMQCSWCARQDLNLHACAMEPKGDVTLVKGLTQPECFIIALQNTYQQSGGQAHPDKMLCSQ